MWSLKRWCVVMGCRALWLLDVIQDMLLEANPITFGAAISACEALLGPCWALLGHPVLPFEAISFAGL